MRVSGEEVFRVSQLDSSESASEAVERALRGGSIATVPLRSSEAAEPYSANPMDAHRVVENVDAVSDVREDVVASLRARIEAGAYAVSGEQVAEMLVRRFYADRVR